MADRVRLAQTGTGSYDWWTSQLEWSAEVRTDLLADWRKNVNAYRDELTAIREESIRVNIEFEKTEQKRHKLFFRNPTLKLRATPRTSRDAAVDPQTNQPGRDVKKAVRVFTEVLQRLAGDKGGDTKTLIDQNLFDVLCPAGHAACLVGYERFENGTIPIELGKQPDPNFQQPGSVLGLQEPPMVSVM